jgi:hypothetical protein
MPPRLGARAGAGTAAILILEPIEDELEEGSGSGGPPFRGQRGDSSESESIDSDEGEGSPCKGISEGTAETARWCGSILESLCAPTAINPLIDSNF